jgi:hypothetical protein
MARKHPHKASTARKHGQHRKPTSGPLTTTHLYALARRVATELHITTNPLMAVPLAALSTSSAVHTYAFPNLMGKWLLNQGATEAAHFLVQHLTQHHIDVVHGVLTVSHQQTLLGSMRHQLSLLRMLRSCLPNASVLKAAYAQVCWSRVAFLDGTWRVHSRTFTDLPHPVHDMVFDTLAVCYHNVCSATPSEMTDIEHMCARWFPNSCERDWVLSYLAHHALTHAADCNKVAVIHCDSLDNGQQEGNRGKSSFQYLLQCSLGPSMCSITHGDALQSHRCHTYMARKAASAIVHPPLVDLFDEVSGSASKSTLDLGSIKYMTRGQPPGAIFWLACNAANLPPLQALQVSDPAAYNRLVFLPARQTLQSTTLPNFHAQMRRLAPAFVAMLMQGANQPLLTLPPSMRAFKELLTMASSAGRFAQAHTANVTM